jgi:hypothetical protein
MPYPVLQRRSVPHAAGIDVGRVICGCTTGVAGRFGHDVRFEPVGPPRRLRQNGADQPAELAVTANWSPNDNGWF